MKLTAKIVVDEVFDARVVLSVIQSFSDALVLNSQVLDVKGVINLTKTLDFEDLQSTILQLMAESGEFRFIEVTVTLHEPNERLLMDAPKVLVESILPDGSRSFIMEGVL